MSFGSILHEKADSETYFTDEEVSAVNVNERVNMSELESIQGGLFSLNTVERQGRSNAIRRNMVRGRNSITDVPRLNSIVTSTVGELCRN